MPLITNSNYNKINWRYLIWIDIEELLNKTNYTLLSATNLVLLEKNRLKTNNNKQYLCR